MDDLTNDLVSALESAMIGCSCRVVRREHDWVFDLSGGTSVRVECHWRLVSSKGIVLTDEDDKQKFGLPEPIDGEARANALLVGSNVTSVTVDRVTADLRLSLSNGLRFELLSNSSGHEGWEAGFQSGGVGMSVVAMGGGGLTFF